jgi:hypothetical protein
MTTDPASNRIAAVDGHAYPKDRAARREAIRAAIEADPKQTNTAIAKRVNASRDLVIEERKRLAGVAITARYDSMCRAIAECEAVDEVKDMRDKAMALELYARQAQNFEAERTAQRIRVRAEKQCGRLLKVEPKAKGGKPYQAVTGTSEVPVKPLAEYGITKNQSSQWQQLADVPDDAFEAALSDEFEPITAASIIERQQPPKVDTIRATINRMNPQALWVWGRVCDYEREKLLDADPLELFKSMTDPMRADMVRLVPQLIAFLSAMTEGSKS